MEMDWAVWGPPLAVLAVSVVFGVWTSARMVAREADLAIGRETRRIDLESTHEEVLDALKQLDLDRDKLDPATWNREREELLARGSGALRALDHAPDGPSAAAAAPAKAEPAAVAPIATGKAGAPPTIAPEWKGALYTLAAVAIGFVLYSYATSEAVDRRDGASMTGNQSLGGSAPMAPAGDPAAEFRDSPMFKDKEKALTEQIAANPQDVEAMNDLTLLYVNAGDPQKAFAQNEAALKVAPKDSDARTLRAVLTAMMGMEDRALELLNGVLADDPTHAMALMFRARLYVVSGKPDEAVKSLEAAVKADPANADLARFLEDTRREVAQMGGAMGAPAAGGPADVLVAGTLQLDPALASKLTGQETLFLSVADPARPRPPVAADKKVGRLSFPLPFQLTTANIVGMPGAGGVAPTLDFKARLDGDGNAMTTEPDLPRVTVSGVKKGTSGMVVTLSLSDAPVPAASAGGAVQESSLLAPAAPRSIQAEPARSRAQRPCSSPCSTRTAARPSLRRASQRSSRSTSA